MKGAAVLRVGLQAPSRAPAGWRRALPDHPASWAGVLHDAGGTCPGAPPSRCGPPSAAIACSSRLSPKGLGCIGRGLQAVPTMQAPSRAPAGWRRAPPDHPASWAGVLHDADIKAGL